MRILLRHPIRWTFEGKRPRMICYPAHMLWWNPKAKKKYKIKKGKEKDGKANNCNPNHVWQGTSWWRGPKFKGFGGGGYSTCSTKFFKKKDEEGWSESEPSKGPWKNSFPYQAKEGSGRGENGFTHVKTPMALHKQKEMKTFLNQLWNVKNMLIPFLKVKRRCELLDCPFGNAKAKKGQASPQMFNCGRIF